MGYVVLHLDKSPDNEVPMTAHIARTKMPPNAIPELTYLNEELVEYPEGVSDRTAAINHRLEYAGLTRKIGTNQVRVIRVMLTGTQEDMKRLVQEGRLKAWCVDNLEWLQRTFGTENVVSAVLHMDEATPHIHAAVVPIVTGERRKTHEKQTNEPNKRKYRTKSASRPRLCADDVMSRVKLKEYQNTYATAMAKYGLQRGIDGSKARHVTTQEFYRNAIAQQQNLQDNIGELLRIEEEKRKAVEHATKQEQTAREELNAVKGELKPERLKNFTAEVGTTILNGIGSMLGTSKVKRQEQELTQLQQEVAARDETIETLQTKIRTMQVKHLQDIEIQKQHAEKLQNRLKRIYDLFPYVHGLLQWESYCRTIGFSKEWIKSLFTMNPYRYTGELQSIEYNHTFKATDAILQFKSNKDSPGGMQLTINGKNAGEWFRHQQIEFYRQIGLNIRHTKIGKGQNI